MNLFPTVYYNVTQLEMQRLADGGTFAYPVEHMEEMLDFFDAYKVNRDVWNSGGIAEPHWQAAFNKAIAADLNPGWIAGWAAREVLNSAIEAHVQYDLPRALRYSFENIFDPRLIPVDLLPDFQSRVTRKQRCQRVHSSPIRKFKRSAQTHDQLTLRTEFRLSS